LTLAPGDVPISTPPRIAVDISGPGRGENTLIGKPAGVDVGVVGKMLEQGWGAVSDPPMGKHGLEGGEGGRRCTVGVGDAPVGDVGARQRPTWRSEAIVRVDADNCAKGRRGVRQQRVTKVSACFVGGAVHH